MTLLSISDALFAWALARLGDEREALSRLREGEQHLERQAASGYEAVALVEPRGMRRLVAHCHLGLATLYGRTVPCEPAQAHLTTATAMYRDMGMRFWLEQAEATRI